MRSGQGTRVTAAMAWCHDHLHEVAAVRPPRRPVRLVEVFDEHDHDPRCMGDCGPCGGAGGVPDTGPDGEMAVRCLTCGGSGRCPGCNAYLRVSGSSS